MKQNKILLRCEQQSQLKVKITQKPKYSHKTWTSTEASLPKTPPQNLLFSSMQFKPVYYRDKPLALEKTNAATSLSAEQKGIEHPCLIEHARNQMRRN